MGRSVKDDAPDRWVGWLRIHELHDRACELDKLVKTPDYHDHSLYFSALFETGCRVNEMLLLRPEQVRWNDSSIEIEHVEVFKRRKRTTRPVVIKRENNLLADVFLQHVMDCKTSYLCPGYDDTFHRTVSNKKPASASHVYKRIVAIDSSLWPHWLRDQRSWHLAAPVEQGGRGFDIYLLKKWFEWKSTTMPAYYAGRRDVDDIRDALGVREIE